MISVSEDLEGVTVLAWGAQVSPLPQSDRWKIQRASFDRLVVVAGAGLPRVSLNGEEGPGTWRRR